METYYGVASNSLLQTISFCQVHFFLTFTLDEKRLKNVEASELFIVDDPLTFAFNKRKSIQRSLWNQNELLSSINRSRSKNSLDHRD